MKIQTSSGAALHLPNIKQIASKDKSDINTTLHNVKAVSDLLADVNGVLDPRSLSLRTKGIFSRKQVLEVSSERSGSMHALERRTGAALVVTKLLAQVRLALDPGDDAGAFATNTGNIYELKDLKTILATAQAKLEEKQSPASEDAQSTGSLSAASAPAETVAAQGKKPRQKNVKHRLEQTFNKLCNSVLKTSLNRVSIKPANSVGLAKKGFESLSNVAAETDYEKFSEVAVFVRRSSIFRNPEARGVMQYMLLEDENLINVLSANYETFAEVLSKCATPQEFIERVNKYPEIADKIKTELTQISDGISRKVGAETPQQVSSPSNAAQLKVLGPSCDGTRVVYVKSKAATTDNPASRDISSSIASSAVKERSPSVMDQESMSSHKADDAGSELEDSEFSSLLQVGSRLAEAQNQSPGDFNYSVTSERLEKIADTSAEESSWPDLSEISGPEEDYEPISIKYAE